MISVIIPCYNVEKYIDICLTSVVSQDIGLSQLEIILVNDASTDNTLEILQKWEQLYPENITVISYEENLRQGGARNIGMQYASGEWIGFVDSDDWIEADMYSMLLSMVTNVDYVRGMLIRENEDGHVQGAPETGSVCTGIYRRNFLLDNEIFFPEHMSYEDNYWLSILPLYSNNYLQVDNVFYHYVIHQGSTVTARNDYRQFDRLTTEIMILEKYEETGHFDEQKDSLFQNAIQRLYLNTWYIAFTRFDEIPDIFPIMKEAISHFFPDYTSRIDLSKYTYRSKLLLEILLSAEEPNLALIKSQFLLDFLYEQDLLTSDLLSETSDELEKSPHSYLIHKKMGHILASTNPKQAFLHYEKALFLYKNNNPFSSRTEEDNLTMHMEKQHQRQLHSSEATSP